MYTGVPISAPVLVLTLPGCSSDSFAIPKSRIFVRSPDATSPSWTRKMFSGLRSRWMMRWLCAAASEPAIERLALEVLHHDVRATVGVIAEVEHLDDPGVADRRHRAGLVEEPVDDVRARAQRGQQDLDRGAPPEQRVLPEVDHPHAALAQLLDDLVATYDCA